MIHARAEQTCENPLRQSITARTALPSETPRRFRATRWRALGIARALRDDKPAGTVGYERVIDGMQKAAVPRQSDTLKQMVDHETFLVGTTANATWEVLFAQNTPGGSYSGMFHGALVGGNLTGTVDITYGVEGAGKASVPITLQ